VPKGGGGGGEEEEEAYAKHLQELLIEL